MGFQVADEYRMLFSNMPQGFALHEIICDEGGKPVDYRFLDINPAFERLTGLSAASLIGKTLLEVMPDTEKSWIERYGNVALTGKSICFESFSGVLQRHYEVTAYSPAPKQFAVIFLDITERKRAAEELHIALTKYKALFNAAPLGITVTDEAGHIIETNAAADRLLDLTGKEQRQRSISGAEWVIFRPDGSPLAPDDFPSVRALREHRVIENVAMIFPTRSRGEIWLSVSASPIDLPGYGVIIVYSDVTEKQRLLEHAQRSDRLASLGVLAGGIAHDFNNLLTGMFGYIDLARSSSPPGKVQECLEKALGILSRTKDLTHQLLTFAKGGTPAKKTGRLSALVPEWTLFALSGSKVTARFEIADDLWPADFDRNQIGQVFSNIVLNAQQAMQRGGEILVSASNVELSPGALPALKPGKYVRISVRDSGPGVPTNILPYIFDPFFTTKQTGSGLGLATAYSIVKKHDGEITVESTDGRGATFHVFLPASENTVTADIVTERAGHSGAGRILVMDDNASIREIFSQMLEMMGYEVDACADGKVALERIRTAGQGRPYDLVFMDLTIPGGMGGKEAVAELRKVDRTTRVVVTSGYFSDPIMANPVAFGFDDRFQKPFSLEELNLLMERLMGSGKPRLRA